MSTCKVECEIKPTDPSAQLGLEIKFNDQTVYHNDWVKDTETFNYEFNDDDDAEHQLSWTMTGKTAEHTRIDEQGNIIKDAAILINNVSFDESELGYTLTQLAKYTHNQNGTAEDKVDPFFNYMGCNGTVTLKFTTPFYLWLLEHM